MDTNTNDTRTNIVNLLKINGKMTVNEVSAQLDMSSMGVRQHLGSLERDGLVEYYRSDLYQPVLSTSYAEVTSGVGIFVRNNLVI